MSDDQPRTISVDEAAEALGIARQTYYSSIRRGEVPFLKIGRCYRVPRLQLERMLSGEEWRVGGAT